MLKFQHRNFHLFRSGVSTSSKTRVCFHVKLIWNWPCCKDCMIVLFPYEIIPKSSTNNYSHSLFNGIVKESNDKKQFSFISIDFAKWNNSIFSYFMFHTYIPTCLIVMMSWISFWIKPEVIYSSAMNSLLYSFTMDIYLSWTKCHVVSISPISISFIKHRANVRVEILCRAPQSFTQVKAWHTDLPIQSFNFPSSHCQHHHHDHHHHL